MSNSRSIKNRAYFGRLVASVVFTGAVGMATPALAQQNAPPTAALQSCSVNNAPCELDSFAGWFVGPSQDAKITQYAAAAVKPSVTTEHRLAADGQTKVVTFKGANGKYLAIQPDNDWQVNFVATSSDDAAAQFVAVAALDNPPGQNFTSFHSVVFQDRFLRHQGYKLFAHPNAGTSLFRRDASWRVLNAATINTPAVLNAKPGQTAAAAPAKPSPKPFRRPAPASHGDVHIISADGLTYDFQATGDFVLFRTLDDEYVLQARQVASEDNPKVSVNRAIAVKIGTLKIEYYLDPVSTLYVNGKVTPFNGETIELENGVQIERDYRAERGMTIWQESSGFGVVILPFGGKYIDTGTTFDANGAPHEGLTGTNDNNRANDLQVRNGAQLPLSPENIAKAGESWRVKKEESLFSIAGPQATPIAPVQPGLADLDMAARQQAIKDCGAAGIDDQYALRTCVYDVAATGDKTFIESAKATQEALKEVPAQERPAPPREDLLVAQAVPAKPAPAPAAATPTAMVNNQSLTRTQFVSMNGHRLQVNPDGNLCLFAETGPNPHRWCVNDEIGGQYAQIQRVAFEAGVLSAYDANKVKLWSSKPVRDPTATMTLTPDGRLVIRSGSGALHWQNK